MQHRKKDGSNERKGTLFGAKITGVGSGVTIFVLGWNCIQSSEEIIEIQQWYKAATCDLPFILIKIGEITQRMWNFLHS